MLEFTRPVLSLLIGLVLAVYGIVHIVMRFPAPSVFDAFFANLPHAAAVLLFLVGVAAVIGGIVMLAAGVRGINGRLREIRRAYGGQSVRPREHEDDQEGWYGSR